MLTKEVRRLKTGRFVSLRPQNLKMGRKRLARIWELLGLRWERR